MPWISGIVAPFWGWRMRIAHGVSPVVAVLFVKMNGKINQK
jgi:hypothetical protein